MARKPNYDFEKRRKEQERKAKQDAKAAAKRERKLQQTEQGEEGTDLPHGTDEVPADADLEQPM